MINLSKTCDFMILLLLVIQYTLGIVIGLATNFRQVAGCMERVHTNDLSRYPSIYAHKDVFLTLYYNIVY